MPLSKEQTELLARQAAASRARPEKAAFRTITASEAKPSDDIDTAGWFRTDGFNRIMVTTIPNGDVTGYQVKFREAFATEDPVTGPVGPDTAIPVEANAFADAPSLTVIKTTDALEPTIYDVSGSRAAAVYVDSITGAPTPEVVLVVTKWIEGA